MRATIPSYHKYHRDLESKRPREETDSGDLNQRAKTVADQSLQFAHFSCQCSQGRVCSTVTVACRCGNQVDSELVQPEAQAHECPKP